MYHNVILVLIGGCLTLCGCTSEKHAEPQQTIPAITLSAVEKAKLQAFQKEILSIENLTDTAVKLAGDELMNFIKSGGTPVNLPAVIDAAKAECLTAGRSLATKAVPEGLPPEVKTLLGAGISGLVAAYTAYGESFGAIKSFVSDKDPMALFEYRKKNAQARELYTKASDTLTSIMKAAGISTSPL
ncbi:MAG: hypothetical protein PHI31_14995 [Desulfuromonadaceae bacterium]|nr:hypothetical protein [Desulfuromonadaceae bacterium]